MTIKKLALVILFFAVLSACSVFLPVTIPEIQTYQISTMHGKSEECKNNPILPAIQITKMKADEPYDGTGMFYSLSTYQLSKYARNRWVASPNGMITKAMQEKLLQSCNYSNVVSADFMTSAKYRLNSQLIELKQNINGQNAEFSLIVLVQLVNNSSNTVVKSKTFIEKIAVAANPYGYVIGTNATVDKFLNDLVAWLATT